MVITGEIDLLFCPSLMIHGETFFFFFLTILNDINSTIPKEQNYRRGDWINQSWEIFEHFSLANDSGISMMQGIFTLVHRESMQEDFKKHYSLLLHPSSRKNVMANKNSLDSMQEE